jgi:hypothetical protein
LWVCSGNLNPEEMSVQVDFCGGTGRFEAVVGGFDVEAEAQPLEPTDDPGIFTKSYCYSGSGTIRY